MIGKYEMDLLIRDFQFLALAQGLDNDVCCTFWF